jgi:ABC-type proline/glycine betaine transport system permease subunit
VSGLFGFLWERRAEILALTGEHVVLVAVASALAVAIGVPVGVALTRRPALAKPVLGLANVVQAIPSLALFGFLIPVPLIGGIGARTAIVALVVYSLLPILRNTYAGIRSVGSGAAGSSCRSPCRSCSRASASPSWSRSGSPRSPPRSERAASAS